ncbi:MAG: hypothetical protein KAX78_00655 [Phycisphaerae bacterium]|nr:hypothetical protein [Phycisphaerae bacterium]
MKSVVSISRSRLRVFLGCVCVFGVLLATACRCPADTLLLKDGRSFEGKLLGRDAKTVTFEIHSFGMKAPRTFKTENVANITEGELKTQTKEKIRKETVKPDKSPKIEGPSFYVIPIKGEIGLFVMADLLEECLKDAREVNPDVVVLEIDSGGGSIRETDKILDVLCRTNDIRLVAYVKEAGSAAAIITLACKEIYAEPQAAIGAAVPIIVLPWRITEVVEEKFLSFLRAKWRAVAERAGHQGILAEAMMDKDIELHITKTNGKPSVAEGTGATMLTRTGRILTLTAMEAVKCGLACDTVNGYEELGRKLGFAKWTKSDRGEKICQADRKELEAAIADVRAAAKKVDKALKAVPTAEGAREAFRGRSIGNQTRSVHEEERLVASAISLLCRVRKLNEQHPRLGLSDKELSDIIGQLDRRYKALRLQRQTIMHQPTKYPSAFDR